MDLTNLRYDINNSHFYINNDKIKILAHENELLKDHILKTEIIFDRLLNMTLLRKFYDYFYQQKYVDINYDNFKKYLYKMLYFHDIAKISFSFQVDRLENDEVLRILKKYGLDKFIRALEPKHSFISSLLYTSHLLNQNVDFENNKLLILFSHVIYGHHTSLKDIIFESEFPNDRKFRDTFFLLSFYTHEKTANLRDYQKLQNLFHDFLETHKEDSKLSFFYSYIYSVLVSSDVIASSYSDKDVEFVERYYSKNWNNRITGKLLQKLTQCFYELDYNKKCKEISSEDLLSNNEIVSLNEINDLRTEMLKEASFNLKNSLKDDPNKKVFYLNMPTGGGKTNTSMKLALDILENTYVDRVIYAMPFINIIEQNYDVIKDNFGLNEDKGEIRKIYSASETIFSKASDDDKSEIIMKDSFFDYPVICTTFVSLFNALIKNKKRYKYSLSSLANSVVILDEIQSLPLRNWTSLYYLINEMAENYNIYFIIMSATLPDFDNLKLSKDVKFDYNSVHLIENPMKYFSHPAFDRTQVDENVFEMEIDADDSSDVMDFLRKILAENFQNDYNHGLIVLNTIKVSKWIYNCLEELKLEYGFEIDLLNSTIIPSEKRKIIYKINNMDEGSKYILVSTQSVEAGVDVSFDFVVRDFATLDSIEQIQGRCNRSRELNERFEDETKKGKVYLTYLKRKNRYDHEFIYDKAELETKIKETRSIIAENPNYDYKNVLGYYESVSMDINRIQDTKEGNFISVDRDNIRSWNQLKYSDLTDSNYGIHIIQNKGCQCSFFVKTKINIFVNDQFPQNLMMVEFLDSKELDKLYKNNEKKFVFTSNELNYLRGYESKYGVQIIKNNTIDGSELIKCYFKEIEKFKEDFGAKKILQKEFSSILYKFIFQVTGDEREFEDLIKTNELEKVGFFYVIPGEKIGNSKDKIYSVETGFNFDFMKLQEENENFI